MAKVFIFSAPSGAGKTTIVNHMLATVPECAFSISATTRKPRGTEQDGVEYYFLSQQDFQAQIAQGAFLEWEEVYAGRYYGTLKREVERLLQAGKHVLFDVDVKGAVSIKRYYGDQACAIFVSPPSLEVLSARLTGRGTDSEQEIQKRLAKAKAEMAYAKQFDQVLVNDDLDAALVEARRLMETHIEQQA